MKRRAGYSLVEVLIAFVIMTLVLSALIPGQAALLGRTSAMEDRLLAHDYALSYAARLGQDIPFEIGTTTQTYRNWRINTTIAPGDPIGATTPTRMATITVFDLRGAELASFTTLQVAR